MFAASGLHTCVLNAVFGLDQYGNPYANFPFDGVVGAIGAFADRDGIDHGGAISSTINPVGSVESWEREIPFLYLYRKELPYSGGHGRWRGGATFVTGWAGYRTEQSFISSGGLFQAVTLGMGVAGGMPATGGTMWSALDTPIREELAAGRLPADPEALRRLAPGGAPPPPKKFDNRLGPADVFEVMPSPGAGYGDPIGRAPELVAQDVAGGRLLAEQAGALYGVVLTGEPPRADTEATARRRDALRAERLEAARPPRRPMQAGPVARDRHRRAARDRRAARGRGRHPPAHVRRVRRRARRRVRELPRRQRRARAPAAGARPQDLPGPSTQVDDGLVVRQYLCPGCAVALDTVVCPAGQEPEWDVLLEGAEEER